MKNAGIHLLSMLLVSAVAAVGCSDKGEKETPAPTAESTDTITVALVASLTGTDQGVGAEAQRGALTAVAQINALGGILGKQIVLRVEDDASNPATTAQKVKDLAEKDKVVFGIGPSTSREAREMLPLIKQDKVLYVSPSATSSELDCVDVYPTPEETASKCQEYKSTFDPQQPQKPILFKTAASDSMLATALAQYASQSNGGLVRCPSIVIVRQNDNYGIPIAEVLQKRYQQLSRLAKGPIDLDPTIDKTQALKDAAQRVGQSAVACQVVIALPGVAAAYMRAFQDYKATSSTLPQSFITIGSDGFRQDQFLVEGRIRPSDPLSETAGEGSFAVAADTAPTGPEYDQFRALFEARYPNVSPGRYSSTAYDAVVLLAGAIARANTTTNIPAVRKALIELSSGRTRSGPNRLADFLKAAAAGEDLDYEGASGTLTFSPVTGNVPNDFGVWQIEGNVFVRKGKFDATELSAEGL